MEFVYLILLIGALGAQFFYFRAYIRKAVSRPESLEGVRKEVDALITELNQNADRNLTLMEQRIGDLQKILAEADRRILLLKKEEEKKQSTAQVYSHLQKNRQVTLSSDTSTPKGSAAPPPETKLTGSDQGKVGVMSTLPAASAAAPEVNQERSAASVQPLTTAQKVTSLEKEGLDPGTIARTLGITLGEVELIQSLRRNQS